MTVNVQAAPRHQRPVGENYKWTALSNTTLGVLLGAMDSSIILISLPDIFKGLHVNPLMPAETGNLLWMMLGYQVVTATLLVSGRDDKIVDPKQAAIAAKLLPQGHFLSIPQCGHAPQMERPWLTNRLVLHFLTSARPTTRPPLSPRPR